ncbi:MAG: zinc-dependent metalloprotease [Pseudomonadota bacterium]
MNIRALLTVLCLLGTPFVLAAEAPPKTFAEITRTMSAQAGFIEAWRDAEQGRVLLAVRSFDTPFLMLTSLPFGLGSNDVGLDRGQGDRPKLVHFEQRGARVFLVQENTRYVADSANRDERASATEAFAASVLWAGDILASEGGRQLVDVSSFLLADRHGIAARLAATKQGSYTVDAKRSAVLTEQVRSFPDNIELEAMLTFQGPGEGRFVRDVGPDPASLTMRQHVSLVRLPEAGFQRRAYHPASGGIDTGYYDFATPLASSIDVRWQLRFRLEKTDPGAAVSTVRKPIVYYVDRGAPEPVRSALLDGARWWTSAFEKAGYKDAYRVELLPEGVDPSDARYNVINWVHRATRGWSYGSPMADPRTGEIIKGTVTLGSQRVRQDILIAESLLAPYGKGGDRGKLAEQMALARLRQLAAHEVGHTLGFSHNFAASLTGNGSVMDYPHPIVRLNAKGEVELGDAYGVGMGEWDDFLVQHAYAQFAPAEEAASLARLRAAVRAKGYQYASDVDARNDGSAHPGGLLWDFGPDAIKTWDQLMAVRQRALQTFSFDVLPDGRQSGEIEARLVPLYLLHRYQTEALARLLGGGEFEYSTSTDVRLGAARAGVRAVPAVTQRQALKRLAASLRAENLALPGHVLDQLTPAAQGYARNREYFDTRMDSVFDAFSAVEAGAAQTSSFLFDPSRLNRLAWQHARDAQLPGLQEVIGGVLQATWKRDSVGAAVVAGEAVQLAANWVVLDALLGALNGPGLHAGVDAQLRQGTREFGRWLASHPASGVTAQSRRQAAELIERFLADPHNTRLRAMPAIPPGAPI